MLMNDYQEKAKSTAIYKISDYPFYGIAEEAGEVMGKMARIARGDLDMSDETTKVAWVYAMAYELGDVLWMVANAAHELGLTLEQIALLNIEKLESRAERNKLQGEGDDR